MIHSSDNWKIFPGGGIMMQDKELSDIEKLTIHEIHVSNLKVLKDFVDNPNSDEGLRLDILAWMWDNLKRINSDNPKKRNTKYCSEVVKFITLINNS